MKYCRIDDDWTRDEPELHCLEHNEPATHCAPNGDDRVCETYAKAEGCNCCPENYDRGEKNLKLYKAAWDRLSPEEQAEIKMELEGE